jgi:hypothetical protein
MAKRAEVHRSCELPLLESCTQAPSDMEMVPECPEQISTPCRPASDKTKSGRITEALLSLKGIFRAKKSAQAVDKPLDSVKIEFVPAAEGINNLGLCKPFLMVPLIVGKLDILNDGPILVFPFYGTHIHAYKKGMYQNACQG